MLRQKVRLPELYRDVAGNVAKFPQNFGPETTKFLGTWITPFGGRHSKTNQQA